MAQDLAALVGAIGPLDANSMEQARSRQARLTKPPGSLGVLEDVAVRLAGVAGCCPPPVPFPAAVAIFAGDHGVHAQGVTPWPQEVTAQMVANFLAGGAAINALAGQVGAHVVVVDVGVAGPVPSSPALVHRRVRPGTRDLSVEAALTRQEVLAAVGVGADVARALVDQGYRCLATGDMGIANTTASAALISAFTGRFARTVTGRGTGVDDATWRHKVQIVERAIALHRPDPDDPIGVLAALGGLEHAAITGYILAGAAARVPVVLDGVIAGSAALAAQVLAPDALDACFAGHRSTERGHAVALEHLGMRALVDLELRLGEGTGAVLALPLVQAAARALRDMATFDSAGVTAASAASLGDGDPL